MAHEADELLKSLKLTREHLREAGWLFWVACVLWRSLCMQQSHSAVRSLQDILTRKRRNKKNKCWKEGSGVSSLMHPSSLRRRKFDQTNSTAGLIGTEIFLSAQV